MNNVLFSISIKESNSDHRPQKKEISFSAVFASLGMIVGLALAIVIYAIFIR